MIQWLLAGGGLLFAAFVVAAPAGETERVFANYENNVVQIRILDQESGSKSSIGSGFLAGSQGQVITNFHVVAELVHHPDQYRAEFLFENGESGALSLLDIDVVHDLALLKMAGSPAHYLTVSARQPAKGERLFSLGNPHDLGLTIVEGTYNGHLEKSLYEKIHFTGSINPGMSGGPTIDRDGAVVGVNVATAGNQLSFLVPASYVIRLLTQPHAEGEAADFEDLIRDQLLANQQQYLEKLLAQPFATLTMDHFKVPGRLANFLNCWGDTQKREDTLYERVFQSCSSSDDIFLSDEQSSGIIRYSHELYTSEGLGALRFFGFLERNFQVERLRLRSDEDMVGNYVCDADFVENKGLRSKVVFCLRAYKNFTGLYDATLMAAVFHGDGQLLQTNLALAGVSYENAVRFPRAYLEAIQWNP
ncbi:MAG: trypsin-like peptidase domain-containing protein [Gammaproteobacteria bacterium]|nr:trypsin-like peptidase domain-containing protein [Gammaproteobacteria bacterium]MCP5424314.1 trypsin-like peptidase domain-containing protein [Gammaproteobacteria bacterium]MCP5459067.1 trypsin-like peptidase domain-containing protein [Gammaproteobacteria bacterium]